MTPTPGTWHQRGAIAAESIRSIAAPGPETVVVLTGAAAHVSKDLGRGFTTTGLGVVAPMSTDLALGDGHDPMLAIAGPAGLFAAVDGHAWQAAQPFPIGRPTAVAVVAGELLVAAGETGQVWATGIGRLVLTSRGLVGRRVDRLVAQTDRQVAWAVADGRVRRSDDGGRTWHPMDLADGVSAVDLAVSGTRVSVLAEDDTVWTWDSTAAAWGAEPAMPAETLTTCLGTREDGGLLVGTLRGLLVLPPGGKRWASASEPVQVTAATEVGGWLFVGTSPGGLLRSSDGGERWERCELDEGTVVADVLVAATGRLLARTADGLVSRSDDGGRSWQAPIGLAPVSMAADGTIRGYGASGDDVQVTDVPPGWLAAPGPAGVHNGARLALADGSAVWRSSDRGTSWRRSQPPDGAQNVVIGLADGGAPGDLAVLTRGQVETTLWSVSTDDAWTSVAREPTTIAHVATPADGRPYATLGASLLRPSRIGARLFVREDPRIGEILALALGSAESGLVACLGRDTIALSRDGGVVFDERISAPRVRPTTAIAIDESSEPPALIAVLLGGGVWSLSL